MSPWHTFLTALSSLKLTLFWKKMFRTSLMILGRTGNFLEEWALLAWRVSALLRRKTTTDPQIRERDHSRTWSWELPTKAAWYASWIYCPLPTTSPAREAWKTSPLLITSIQSHWGKAASSAHQFSLRSCSHMWVHRLQTRPCYMSNVARQKLRAPKEWVI